jgi:antirestriction protein ArdC
MAADDTTVGSRPSRQGHTANLWLGYGQAQELGGHVKKGEKGTHGIIYKPLVVDDEEAEDGKRTIPMLKTFVVFNLDQIEGLEHLRPALPDEGVVFEPIQVAEEILTRSGATIVEGGTRAYYRKSEDKIGLPDRFRFKMAEDYYTTGLHELTHWTGHENRLDRSWGKRFGDQAYAFEELVAEMGSAFLTAKLGLQGELQHANYIAGWLQVLKQDERALIRAASLAQKAFEFIHALVEEPKAEATAGEGSAN